MTATNYARTERQTPYMGSDFDEFSKLMYSYVSRANLGFTFTDIDGILRNHKKRTIGIIEVKTRNGSLTYAQEKTFNELEAILTRGCNGTSWTFVGFSVLRFERTSFEDGKAWFNDDLTTQEQFLQYLTNYF
jgi:hypothetical protein